MNFNFKKGFKNEFEDNNGKSCSRFKNRAPLKIDFKSDWTILPIFGTVGWVFYGTPTFHPVMTKNEVYRF